MARLSERRKISCDMAKVFLTKVEFNDDEPLTEVLFADTKSEAGGYLKVKHDYYKSIEVSEIKPERARDATMELIIKREAAKVRAELAELER